VAILLVEDEALIQEIMAESLRDDGFEVIQAATGDEAIAIIAHLDHPPEALVSDFHMPGNADGADVAAAARTRYPGLPVIIASGRPDVLARFWEPDLGYRFLGKPFLPRQLITLLRDMLEPPHLGRFLTSQETRARR
jgi:DNA-binding NtrC family response regulator